MPIDFNHFLKNEKSKLKAFLNPMKNTLFALRNIYKIKISCYEVLLQLLIANVGRKFVQVPTTASISATSES